jgi:hypothetical protein
VVAEGPVVAGCSPCVCVCVQDVRFICKHVRSFDSEAV